MKTALHDFFDKYIEMWKSFSGSEPRIAFDEDIQPILYVGDMDEDEYICWLPKNKDVITDFSSIENDYKIVVNQDIKEYFNSYWFLDLKGFYNGTNVILEPVIPGKELEGFIQQLQGYYMVYNEISCMPIGFEANNNNLIVVDNSDGNVYYDDLERKEKVYVAESLKEFISKISFNR